MVIIVGWTPMLRAQFVARRELAYVHTAKFLHGNLKKSDTVVARWADGFTLSQFFPKPKTFNVMLPDQYLKKVAPRLDTPSGGRVFYVTWSRTLLRPLPTTAASTKGREAPARTFENLEVATYEGKTVRELLEEWRQDLLFRTAGRIAPVLHNDYELLALIEELLPSNESPDHWRYLADRCAAPVTAERTLHPPVLFP
jgi:hypothetical protein